MALTICALATFASMPVAAQIPVVTPAKAIEAARDCAAAADIEGVDIDALVEQGWALAEIKSEDEAVESPLRVLGKSSGSPLIVTSTSDGPAGKGCLITGGLTKRKAFDELKDAFAEAFVTAGVRGDDTYFRIGRDIAILSQTGTRRKPSFRVAVMELGEKN